MTALNIYTAQVNPIVGDVAGNKKLILKYYKQALSKNADICLLPEAVLCGYTPQDLVLRPNFIAEIKKAVIEIVGEISNTALMLSTPWIDENDGKTYNAVHFIHNNEIKQTVYKQCLPNFGVMDEKRVFAKGINNKIIPFKGVNIGLLVCHDTWWPKVADTLKQEGADILISINASPYELGKEHFRIGFCKERVAETGLPLIYANLVGGQDEILFDGRCFSINPNEEASNIFSAWVEESKIIKLENKNSGFIFKQGENAQSQGKWQNIHEALKLGFGDYMRKSGFKTSIIGISGGIDSALTAAIAVDTLGKENVTGILLPSKNTSDHSNDDAIKLAQNLGIKTYTLPIEETVCALEKALKTTGELKNVTLENLQARARGTLLMGLSNNTGSLLITTGNKSEVAVGFCTLYGDMNGGFNIIKDLYKTEVYALSHYINRNKEIIPLNSIKKEPTPELSEGQKDSDNLPPYEILDSILRLAIEDRLGLLEIVAAGFERKTVEKILCLLKNSEHKRYQGAPGVKISKVAFGADWRYPIVNKHIF